MSTALKVNVCWSRHFLIRRVMDCPVCKRRRRFVLRDGAWYGITFTCCGCGDRWSGEGREPRPFQRGWRPKAIAAARREWDAAGRYDKAAHMTWLRAEMGFDDPMAVAEDAPLPDDGSAP